MTRKIFLTLILLPLFTFGSYDMGFTWLDEQDDPKTNQLDKQGRKQGKWVFLGKDQPEKGYPMDGKISEGTFKDDRKHGRWIMYYKDGITPKTEGEFVDNRPNGPFIRYHQNGKVKEIGTFSQRKYKDSLIRFNEKGVKVYDATYNDQGKEEGTVTHYFDNGKPEFSYQADNGIPKGKAVRYWPNGDVREEIVYSEDGSIESSTGEISPERELEDTNDKKPEGKIAPVPNKEKDFEPNGYNKVFNDDKELWMEGDFKDGVLYNGRLYVYDEDGLLLKVEVYKEGVYHSDGQL